MFLNAKYNQNVSREPHPFKWLLFNDVWPKELVDTWHEFKKLRQFMGKFLPSGNEIQNKTSVDKRDA